MRFIDTSTLDFVEIADSELSDDFPNNKYANLSHRGGEAAEEVSYVDISESRDFHSERGYAKLKGFCDLAASLGYRYAWADTSCINKGDLNELNEAINSMYRWYQGSDTCIVYLENELIGPRNEAFYDRDWNLLGRKTDLVEDLFLKTGIPADVLSHAIPVSSCSVAQRMSWAANRTTKRIEDRAYSLLGIFGVNMPQIYGERERAFRRLQQAIVQQGKDESIFAWAMPDQLVNFGLYAPSVEAFAECSDIISMRGSTGFSENNGEISISLKTYPHSMETYYALLNCAYKSDPAVRPAIFVARSSIEGDDYVRVPGLCPGGIYKVPEAVLDRFQLRPVHIPIDPTDPPLAHAYGFWLRTVEPPGYEDAHVRILSKARQGADPTRVCIHAKDFGSAGVVYVEPNSPVVQDTHIYNQKGWSRVRWIKLGFDEDFNPVILLANGIGPSVIRFAQFRRDPALFEQAVCDGHDSQAHKTIFENHWLYSQANVRSASFGWPNEITILKVDRTKGTTGADISPSNDAGSGRQSKIWAVDITDSRGSDPEEVLRHRENEASCNPCIAFCCERGRAVSYDAKMDSMKREATQKKVMTQADLARLKL